MSKEVSHDIRICVIGFHCLLSIVCLKIIMLKGVCTRHRVPVLICVVTTSSPCWSVYECMNNTKYIDFFKVNGFIKKTFEVYLR